MSHHHHPEHTDFVGQCACFTDLFDQLGLPSSPPEVAQFILQHRPLPDDVLLIHAPFWSEAQSQFLHEKKQQDEPPWNILIDQLSTALRA